MKCFGTGSPNLTSQDFIFNKKSKTMFAHLTELSAQGKNENYNGTTIFDNSGMLQKTDSFATLQNLQYGAALCQGCDISNCVCELHLPLKLIQDLSAAFPALPPIPAKLEVPWQFLQSPDGWNAKDVSIDATDLVYWTMCFNNDTDLSGLKQLYDGSKNVLANPTTLGGNYICPTPLELMFGSISCDNKYYPAGTYSMRSKDIFNSLANSNDAALAPHLKAAGFGGRPAITVDNYLQNLNGFKLPSRIRFKRIPS